MLLCLLIGLGVVAALFCVALGTRLWGTDTAKNRYKHILLSVYLGGVLWLTLVNRVGMEISRVRFQPFYVLRQMLNCWFGFRKISAATCRAVFRNSPHLFDSAHASPVEDLFLNVILFMPMGFLLPYVWPKLTFCKTLLLGALWAVGIEAVQYWAHWGCCDIDDVINDTLGTCIGYVCWALYRKVARVEK